MNKWFKLILVLITTTLLMARSVITEGIPETVWGFILTAMAIESIYGYLYTLTFWRKSVLYGVSVSATIYIWILAFLEIHFALWYIGKVFLLMIFMTILVHLFLQYYLNIDLTETDDV